MGAVKSYLSGPGGVRFVTLLYGLDTLALEAVVESGRLGQLRTGAATALSARALAAPGPQRLGLLGTGTVAWGQLEALQHEVKLVEVRVHGRDPDRMDRFCQRARSELGVEVRPASTPAQAVAGATLVVTATTARRPLVEPAMLAPEVHLCAVGANRLGARELDAGVVERCGLIVVDDLAQARLESEELKTYLGPGGTIPLELQELVSRPLTGPRPPWTLFKSLGVGLEDLAAACRVWRRAVELGVGVNL